MAKPVGLLPAAGRGLRFGGAGYAKELFPLLFTDGVSVQPRPICALSLQGLADAGADRCVVVVSPDKLDVVRVLGNGSATQLAYVVQPEPGGLPQAVSCAQPWLGDSDVLLALPDTIVVPSNALARVHQRLKDSGADLVLGVFPVDEPERFGPVAFAADGTITRVLDKPGHREITDVWGVAGWSSRFTEFCVEWERHRAATSGEGVISHVFAAAIAAGLVGYAVPFPEGSFLDIGTPNGLRDALRRLVAMGDVETAQANPLQHRR